MEKANKQQVSDLELENITGGGVAAYAIKGGCAFAGMTLGIFAYCKNTIPHRRLSAVDTGGGSRRFCPGTGDKEKYLSPGSVRCHNIQSVNLWRIYTESIS